ncbi:MAG: GrpB family protein [Oscillospiraceae bacterium]|nr:GrpB family protein [Oscillospiraceae bacterium]
MIAKEKKTTEFYDYDPLWETKAENIINQLKNIFKEYAADIQHIGGTAIKKIKSRPVIDIAVGIIDLSIIDSFKDILKSNGFVYDFKKSKNYSERILLFQFDDKIKNKKTYIIYIVEYKSKLWFDYIIFRDYLNLNDNKAREYENLKLSVNGKYKYALPSYIKAKCDFINKTIADNFYTMMLGKNITVKLNFQTAGNYPKYSEGVYPLSYGYIKNLSINAYVIGIYDYDISEEINGEIIAYIDIDTASEKSFIVAKENMIFYKPDIAESINFYFKSHQNNNKTINANINIICMYEKSCGAVVYATDDDGIKFLLLKGSSSNSIGFPKGHIEKGETEVETAIREIYEETSLNVVLHSDFKESYEYTIYGYIHKKVTCFLAEFNISDKYKIRDSEILEQWLVPYDKAYELLTFNQAKVILKKAYEKIKEIK